MNNMTASRVEFPKTFIIEVLWFHVTRAVENYEVLTFDSILRALGVPKNQKESKRQWSSLSGQAQKSMQTLA